MSEQFILICLISTVLPQERRGKWIASKKIRQRLWPTHWVSWLRRWPNCYNFTSVQAKPPFIKWSAPQSLRSNRTRALLRQKQDISTRKAPSKSTKTTRLNQWVASLISKSRGLITSHPRCSSPTFLSAVPSFQISREREMKLITATASRIFFGRVTG